MKGTTIIVTPPSAAAETIKVYNSVTTNQSTTDRAGSFMLSLPFHSTADITAYVVGTDVQITQGTHSFRGFVKTKVFTSTITENYYFKFLTYSRVE